MKPIGAYLLGGPLAALVALAFLGYSEHAVVKLTVVARQVQVENVALHGLATTQIQASATEQQTVTSPVVQLPATVAGGRVTFSCSPMTSCPNGYTVAAGTILGSTAGAQYRTLSAVSFPSCAPSSPVAVSALSAGAAGNAGAGTVVYGQFPAYIHVSNSSAIAGGTDASAVPVVQQSDFDAAGNALTAKVSAELGAKLRTQAGTFSYFTIGAPAFTSASDARVGDNAPTLTVTVTGTVKALAYSTHAADGVLRQALSQSVPAGDHLTSARIKATYSLAGTGEIVGSASGFAIPAVDGRSLATALRGQSPSDALSAIGRSVPGAAADIRLTPIALPFLPVFSDHISVVVVVRGSA